MRGPGMSVLVGLVRHGAHDELGRVLSGRSSDIAINAAGQAEAAALAARLQGRGIVRIDTSPRLRTRQTAAILGEALGIAPAAADGLDEIDFGRWSGRAFADLDGDPAWDRWNAARASAGTPGGETMDAAVTRALRHIDAVAAAGGGPVLCVSHCDIIRGVIARILGLSLDHLLRFEIGTGSVSWLAAHGQGAGHIITVNGTA